MATVKFHAGTKFETSLDLEADEGVIFVKPEKNRITRFIGSKWWLVNVVITNKRLVTIPLPPNKKNRQVESYYFKDISGVERIAQVDKSTEASFADFCINMKSGGNSTIEGGGKFQIMMVFNLLNLFTAFRADAKEESAKNAALYGTQLRVGLNEDATYTKKSLDKYYATMEANAKARAANMNFSNAGHQQMRDYIVDFVNQCVETVNA